MNIIAVDLEKLRAKLSSNVRLTIGLDGLLECLASRAEWESRADSIMAGSCDACSLYGMPGALCARHAAVDDLISELRVIASVPHGVLEFSVTDAIRTAKAALAKAGRAGA